MFGRQPRLPVDLAFKLPVQEGQHSSHSEYVQNLKSRLKESYKIAMEKAVKIAHKNKTRYLPVEESSGSVQKPVPRRPGTRTHPAIEEEDSSNEDDVLISVYLSPSVPTVCGNPVQPDPPTTNVEDIQHTEPPGTRPVDNPVNAQNVDSTPDLDNPPDVFDSTSDDPLVFMESNLHEADIEYLLIDKVTPMEQADETLTRNDLTEYDFPNVQREQLPVPSNMLDIDEKNDGIRVAEPAERKEETDTMEVKDRTIQMDTNDAVRRSERNRQLPRRLDYTELGNTLLTAVKSFLQGLSTAWADIITDDEEPAKSPALFP
ncbi:hypothetical protein SRHO_G00177110 [Serrasalmus rhombeus]